MKEYTTPIGKRYAEKQKSDSVVVKLEATKILAMIETLIQNGDKLPYHIQVSQIITSNFNFEAVRVELLNCGVVIEKRLHERSYNEYFVRVVDFY